MQGFFSNEALEQCEVLLGATYDFTRCVRPDGSAYGTGGKCRKGIEQSLGNPLDKVEGDVERITGGNRRARLEKQKEKLENKLSKVKKPSDTSSINSDLKNLNKELDRFKASEKFLKDLVVSLPKETSVDVSRAGHIMTSSTTKSGHTLSTFFREGEISFTVNGEYDRGTVKTRKEKDEVVELFRKVFGSHVRSLPDGSTMKLSAWVTDGYGDSRVRAFERLGFSAPETTTESGKVISGKPGDWQYAKKINGRLVPATSEEQSGDQTFNFGERLEGNGLWYIALFGIPLKGSDSPLS